MNHELIGFIHDTRTAGSSSLRFQAPVLKEKRVMKKVLMITLALTLCASAAFADHEGTYSDTAGMSCTLTNFVPFPGQTSAYVVHKNNSGATASQFAVIDASGLAFAGFTSPYLTIGTLADLSVAYGGCLAGDLMIVQINWFALPGTFTCDNKVSLAPAPTSPLPGEIAIADCNFQYRSSTGGVLWVGPDAEACKGPSPCDPVPVAETTWGGIKALYR
jgi:hypothetical protein